MHGVDVKRVFTSAPLAGITSPVAPNVASFQACELVGAWTVWIGALVGLMR